MASFMLDLILVFMAVLNLSESSVIFHVTPKSLEPGLTENLITNCTFSFDASSNMTSLISITISKSENKTTSTRDFFQIASVDTFSQGNVTQLSNTNASVSSHIAGGDNSFLSLTWAYPSEVEGGVYKCEANGLDTKGHPVPEAMIFEVEIGEIGKEQLVNEIRKLRLRYDILENRFNKFANEENLRKTQSDELVNFKFFVPRQYKNQKYFISKHNSPNVEMAELTCEAYGGYLVEFNDADELNFVNNFTAGLKNRPENLYIGIRLVGDQWQFLTSGNVVPSDVIARGKGVNTSYFCAYHYKTKWYYSHCDASYRFICEVPML